MRNFLIEAINKGIIRSKKNLAAATGGQKVWKWSSKEDRLRQGCYDIRKKPTLQTAIRPAEVNTGVDEERRI